MEPQRSKDEGAKDQGLAEALVMSFFDLMKPMAIALLAAGIIVLGYLIYEALFPPSYWQRRELERNRAKWEQQHIAHYRIWLTHGCFCEHYMDGSWRSIQIEVRDDAVVSAVDAHGQPYADEPIRRVSDLFRLAYGAMGNPNESVGVTYHAQLGYPTHVSIADYPPVVDEGDWYDVERLEVLP